MSVATINDFLPKGFTIVAGKAPVARPCSVSEAIAWHAMPHLGQLETNHMSQTQRGHFEVMIQRVREWREKARNEPGISFMLMSKQVGVGKTHIARSVVTSFSELVGDMLFLDDKPQFAREKRARLYTARELIHLLGGDDALDLWQIAPKHVSALVIDDLGREGYLDYVKAAEQAAEKQSRYFHLINHLYQRKQSGRHPVSIFITTNLNTAECQELLGEAVWSRLLELCPRGFIVQLDGLDDYRPIKSGRVKR